MLDPLAMLKPSSAPYAAQHGFSRTFAPGQLTLGLFFPIESFSGEFPTMSGQVQLAKLAEAAGFAALWLRDVPLYDPTFGDVGQIYDPFVYLGYLAGQTTDIALATGSIVVPIRNPLHLAKAATSVDQLSGGRLLLGVASGDRPVEFPAFGVNPDTRAALFREYVEVFRQVQKSSLQPVCWSGGSLAGADMIPKPVAEEIPLLITGSSRQSVDWIARNGHGWITYPRPPTHQKTVLDAYRAAVRDQCGDIFKPFTQSLYIDLAADPNAMPQPIHLGYRLGRHHLIGLLEQLRDMGVNHVTFNLRFSLRPVPDVINELAQHVLPQFPPMAMATS
ncbi:luciferase-type oxidoreductase [Hoeflea marina]|uniref:Luciferase-type oxidoreductase n=1 Tax=Hoeflea marina TaxID=274592 RepID=A0A317PPE4_9HYPH|nr:LLM class oxidoreductase [Hoeflea marina]PWW03378.1 luciferase-type oxidoreductase [Hoeflea marina]